MYVGVGGLKTELVGISLKNFISPYTNRRTDERAGVCAIEVSGGISEAGEVMSRRGVNSPEREAYFRDYARMIKHGVGIPVMLVGGMRSRGVMEEMLERGYADMVALSRPLIREPELVVKFREGVQVAECTSCNGCFDERGVRCNSGR